MNEILLIVQIIISVILIILILLQQRGGGLGSAFGGGGGEGEFYTSRRGIEKKIFGVTIVFAAIFIVLALLNLIL